MSEIKPLITFIDDDGRIQVLSKLEPLSQSYEIPFVLAIISEKVGSDDTIFMTQTQLHQLEDMGWEISSHTVTHQALGDLTEEEQEYEIKYSKEMLETMGFTVNTICYPYGSANDTTHKIVKKYYRAGRRTDHSGCINMAPVETYDMVVTPLGSYFDTSTQPYPTNSLNFYKYQVDKAVENNGWLIFMTHSFDSAHDATQQLYLEQTIQYIISLGVEVVTYNEGLNRRGNIIDVGRYYTQDLSQDHYVVGADGSFDGNKMQNVVRIDNFTNREFKLPKGYEYKKVSYEYVEYSEANEFLFPESLHGNLITMNTNTYSREEGTFKQIYLVGINNNMYIRSSVDDDTWSEWSLVNDFVLLPEDAVALDSPRYDFPLNKLSKVMITTGDNRPESVEGILTTDRRASHNYFVYQTYEPTERSSIYRRHWINATSSWSSWMRETTLASTTTQRNDISFQHNEGDMIFDTTLGMPVWCKNINAYEIDTLSVTAGAIASGNVTISLNGVDKTVEVIVGDTASDVATKIRTVAFSGWDITGTESKVIYNKTTYGVNVMPIFTAPSLTGVTGTFTVTTAGSSMVWVDATGMAV